MDPDAKFWCSTMTDDNHQHMGGGGNYGHCPDDCNKSDGVPKGVIFFGKIIGTCHEAFDDSPSFQLKKQILLQKCRTKFAHQDGVASLPDKKMVLGLRHLHVVEWFLGESIPFY